MSNPPFSEIDFFKKRLSATERLLAVKQQQIDSLLEITRAVNSNMPVNALSRIYENILHAQIGVSKVALFIKNNDSKWVCITPGELPQAIKEYPVEQFAPFQTIVPAGVLKDELLKDFEFLIPVLHNKEPVGYALISSFGNDQKDTKEEKLKFIQTITNIIVVANENKKLFQLQLAQMMMQNELSLASKMQNLLVPTVLPDNDMVEAAAYYKPHKDVGGDYYDFVNVGEKEIAFCVGDISGKGMSAALLMANFQANFRALVSGNYSPTDIVHMLNQKVAEIAKREKYITFFFGTYQTDTRMLSYINAGHNPSILHSNNEIQLLEKGCTILGMFDQLPFVELGQAEVAPGAVVVNYTDGISEASNKEGDLFETGGRLTDFINRMNQLPLPQFNTELMEEVNRFRKEKDFDDDVTLLTIRFK